MSDVISPDTIEQLMAQIANASEHVWLLTAKTKGKRKKNGQLSVGLQFLTSAAKGGIRHCSEFDDLDDDGTTSLCGLNCEWFLLGAWIDCETCGETFVKQDRAIKMTRLNAQEIEAQLRAADREVK